MFEGPPSHRSAIILARLDRISIEDLEELVTEAWLVRAPPRVARAYLDGTG